MIPDDLDQAEGENVSSVWSGRTINSNGVFIFVRGHSSVGVGGEELLFRPSLPPPAVKHVLPEVSPANAALLTSVWRHFCLLKYAKSICISEL